MQREEAMFTKNLRHILHLLGITGAALLCTFEAQADCNITDFIVLQPTTIHWTDDLKLSFLLTANKEQYDSVRKSWGASGSYGLYSGSLDYNDARDAALKESQTRKFDYSDKQLLDYSAQRLSGELLDKYSECLEKDKQTPGLRMWVAERQSNVFYTIKAFWVGNEGQGRGKQKSLVVDGASLVQKPDSSWPSAIVEDIYVKKPSPAQDAFVSLNVEGKTKTLFLPGERPDPETDVVFYKPDDPRAQPKIGISSGGSDKQDEWCQYRTSSGCVYPDNKPGAYLEAGSGHLVDEQRIAADRVGWKVTVDTPRQICIQVWASTGDCRVSVSITGRPAANERYYTAVPVTQVSAPATPSKKGNKKGNK
jgi:hypothetical protein